MQNFFKQFTPKDIAQLPSSFWDNFWSKVAKTDGGCWSWTGTKTKRGYGVVGYQKQQYKVHRLSVVFSGRTIENNLVCDHICRNHSCVNPEHIRVVSNEENVMAGESFGPKNKEKEVCKRGHPFSEYGGTSKAQRGSKKGVGLWRWCRRCQNDLRNIRRKLYGKAN